MTTDREADPKWQWVWLSNKNDSTDLTFGTRNKVTSATDTSWDLPHVHPVSL